MVFLFVFFGFSQDYDLMFSDFVNDLILFPEIRDPSDSQGTFPQIMSTSLNPHEDICLRKSVFLKIHQLLTKNLFIYNCFN